MHPIRFDSLDPLRSRLDSAGLARRRALPAGYSSLSPTHRRRHTRRQFNDRSGQHSRSPDTLRPPAQPITHLLLRHHAPCIKVAIRCLTCRKPKAHPIPHGSPCLNPRLNRRQRALGRVQKPKPADRTSLARHGIVTVERAPSDGRGPAHRSPARLGRRQPRRRRRNWPR